MSGPLSNLPVPLGYWVGCLNARGCSRVQTVGSHSIQEMRGTNMIWFGAAEKRRRFRAKWNGICHSATRLVGVHRIISCLTSRAHGASISMVSVDALDSQTRKSSLSYAYYSDYKLSVALPRTCVGHGVMASRI